MTRTTGRTHLEMMIGEWRERGEEETLRSSDTLSFLFLLYVPPYSLSLFSLPLLRGVEVARPKGGGSPPNRRKSSEDQERSWSQIRYVE